MTRLLSTLLASTALWSAPDAPTGPAPVAPLDLGDFDAAMGDNGASSQATDGFEEIDQKQAEAEILQRHQSVQHIDSDDDETSTGVKFEGDGGDVEEGGQKRDKAATPPAPAAPATAEGEDETKLPQWVQDRLAREKRKTARAEAELTAARQTPAPKPADQTPAAPAEAPKAADFEDFEEYMEAKALFDKSQKAPKPKDAPAPNSPDSAASEAMRVQIAGAIGEINAVLEVAHPELHKIVNDPANPKGLKITPSMVLAISETDNPAAVLQAFADNPALSVEIAGLPEAKAIARILKLDKPGAAKPAAAPKPGAPQPKLSQAPEPIAPLDGNNRAQPSYDEADFSTFEQQRKAEEGSNSPFDW